MCPCISRSATPPATGAMSWRARASPIPPPREVLNRDFVSIKVDREERPEVDQIYMRALHALGEQGGWPLTMFLTPDAEPFWGGTYFPPEPRWGRPSFRQILGGVSAAWQTRRRRGHAPTPRRSAQHLNTPAGRSDGGAPSRRSWTRPRKTILSDLGHAGAAASKARRNSPTRSCSTRSGAPACAPATRLSRRGSDTLT